MPRRLSNIIRFADADVVPGGNITSELFPSVNGESKTREPLVRAVRALDISPCKRGLVVKNSGVITG